MFITLFVNKTFFSRPLPDKCKGQFWFGDPDNRKAKKLLEFEGRDGRWLLYSGKSATVYDSAGNPIRCVPVSPFSLFTIRTDAFDQPEVPLTLFVEPDRQERDDFLRLYSEPGSDLTIGSQPMNDLIYPVTGVAASHATLTFSNDRWTVVDNGSPAGTYVNGARIANSFLQPGDTVYILGLIITIREGYIEFNNPGNKAHLNENKFMATNTKNTCFGLRSAMSDSESEHSEEQEPTGSIGTATNPLGWSENESEAFSGMTLSGASPLGMQNALESTENDGYEGATTILGMENAAPVPPAPAKKKSNPRLICDKTGEEIPITSVPFTIGKVGCSFCITDNKAVSRNHAKITSDNGQDYFLTDNGSTNKTYLEGKALAPQVPVPLTNGCKMRFANEHFTFLV